MSDYPAGGTSIQRLSRTMFLVGVVGGLLSIGYRYVAMESRQPKLEVGATNVLQPWAKDAIVLVQDSDTLAGLMYVDTEDLFLPTFTFQRQKRAMEAYQQAIENGKVHLIENRQETTEARNLESVTWNPEYRGVLLDTPRMLKIEVLSGKDMGRIAWVSSHWVDSDGKSGERLKLILGKRLGLAFATAALIVLIRVLPRAMREYLFVRRRYGSVPLSARLMMARYRLSSYSGFFFVMCLLTLMYALPRAIKETIEGSLPVPEICFIVLLSMLAVTVIVSWTTPPTVVVLGRSATENVRCFLRLESLLEPAKSTCLLTGVNMSLAEARKLAPRGLRLAQSPHWRLVVTHLIDLAPAIVFLKGDPTPQVEEEREYVEATGYEGKCIDINVTSPDEGVVQIRALLNGSNARSLRDGHSKAWVWVRRAIRLHTSGMRDVLTSITEGQRLMRVLQCGLTGGVEEAESDQQRLADFPSAAIGHDSIDDVTQRGLWMVRCIYRGVVDEIQRKRIHQPQYLAICYGELARVELLAGNSERSGDWAREALKIITAELGKAGNPRLSAREDLELGSIRFCLAESLAAKMATAGVHLKQESHREYDEAISCYERVGVSTLAVRNRKALLV